MFFKKKSKIELPKEFTLYPYNMKEYYQNIESIGIPTKEFHTKELPVYGQRYYQYNFNHVVLSFSVPKKKGKPVLILANNMPIGEVSIFNTPMVLEYLTHPFNLTYRFSGGNFIQKDFDDKIIKGFYPYYCDIVITI